MWIDTHSKNARNPFNRLVVDGGSFALPRINFYGQSDFIMSQKTPIHWTTDHKQWYHEVYLKSDHWKNLKARKFSVNPVCQRCGSVDQLDVHHVNYRQLFDVRINDLLTLCRACHNKEHETNGLPRRKRISYQKYFPPKTLEAIGRSKELHHAKITERIANRKRLRSIKMGRKNIHQMEGYTPVVLGWSVQ